MGFSTQRFVQTVDPNLLCAVCAGVLEDAVLTPCGHSFCSLCLHTWLARPAPRTCPECRADVTPNLVQPVHALRNLVRGLHVQCDHVERGCQEAVALDSLASHLHTCLFRPVPCAGCGQQVSRLELAEHQMTCAAIAASIEDDDVTEGGEGGGSGRAWQDFRDRVQAAKTASAHDVNLLLSRIRTLEKRVERLLQEVKCARTKNLTLERECEKMTAQLRLKHNEIRDLQDTRFFLEHECARSPETIAKLSLLIARHLLEKPRFVESDAVFCALGRCYDKFHRRGPDCQHDLHMLLATAYASNWFSPCQRLSLHCWLQTLTRPAARAASCLFNN